MDPTAVTIGRVRRACERLELAVAQEDDSGVCVLLFPHVFHLLAEQAGPFVGFGIFHRYVDVQHADLAAELVRRHNKEFYSPKLFTVVSDEGKILFQLSHTFGWSPHAADRQMIDEIDAFLGSAVETFLALEDDLPDPWALSYSPGAPE